MKFGLNKSIYILLVFSVLVSCEYNNLQPSCDDSTLLVEAESTHISGCGLAEGVISISATGGERGYTYSINDGGPQRGAQFSNLIQGIYDVKVTDNAGCTSVVEVIVLSGLTYANDARPIFVKSCAVTDCHVAGTGLPQWLDYDVAQANAAKIKTLTQSRIMPLIGELTQEEIDILACWADDGGPE